MKKNDAFPKQTDAELHANAYRLLREHPTEGLRFLRLVLSTLAGRKSPTEVIDRLRTIESQQRLRDLRADIPAKGLARELISQKDIREHLDGVAHLGILSPLSRVSATRLDYAWVQCGIGLQMKTTHGGLGLGSKFNEYENITGLELVQSISILLNCGHLFGTFATERALLYWIERDNRSEELIESLPEDFRDWARQLLETKSIYRFHNILAVLFADQLPSSDERSKALALLRDHAKKWERRPQIDWVIKSTRRIAYNRMHEIMFLGNFVHWDEDSSIVRHCRGSARIGFEEEDDGRALTQKMLGAFDEYHAETFFNRSAAAQLVLAHLHEFSSWWAKHRSSNLSEVIDLLRKKPDDWPTMMPQDLDEWCRLKLPCDRSWIEVVDALLTNNHKELWQTCDFVVTPLPNPATPHILIDIYSRKMLVPVVNQMASFLAPLVEKSWSVSPADQAIRDLWRSIAEFGMSLLSELLPSGISIYLRPCRVDDQHAGYAILGRNTGSLKRLKKVSGQVQESGRRRELDVLAEYWGSVMLKKKTTVLAFLGSIVLTENGVEIGELDGVLVEFLPTEVVWRFLEVKESKRCNTKANHQVANLKLLFGHNSQLTSDEDFSSKLVGKVKSLTFSWKGEKV